MTAKSITLMVFVIAVISAIWYHEMEGLVGCIVGFIAGIAAVSDSN